MRLRRSYIRSRFYEANVRYRSFAGLLVENIFRPLALPFRPWRGASYPR